MGKHLVHVVSISLAADTVGAFAHMCNCLYLVCQQLLAFALRLHYRYKDDHISAFVYKLLPLQIYISRKNPVLFFFFFKTIPIVVVHDVCPSVRPSACPSVVCRNNIF